MYLVVGIWVEGLGVRGKPFARTSSLQDTRCQISCEVKGSAEVGLQSVGLKDQGEGFVLFTILFGSTLLGLASVHTINPKP